MRRYNNIDISHTEASPALLIACAMSVAWELANPPLLYAMENGHTEVFELLR
jgi:hypothetical protein